MQKYDNNFINADDFVDCVKRGCEIEFVYNNKNYSITHHNNKVIAIEVINKDSEMEFDNPADVLKFPLGDKKLGDILQDMKIIFRTF